MTRMQLVVIGNGMAGMRTVEELLQLAPDKYDITVIGREPHGNYNRIMLSPVLAGEKAFEDIVIHPLSWYAERGITLLAGHTVTAVDRVQRRVTTDQGTDVSYDRLLLATGSLPFMVPLPGHDHPDVISFRDIADVRRMLAPTSVPARVAVLGGGLLGLEAANGLVKQGMKVTVVNDAAYLLNRQLDEEASKLLRSALEANGIAFKVSAMSSHISHQAEMGKLKALHFKDGSELPCDLLVMAVGVRPNVALARSMGLQVDKAILVNDTLQTFDPRVYAVGECVQHRGALFGLVAPLYDQAKVCANHLAEMGISRYIQRPTATTLKVSGVALFSAGDFNHETADKLIYRDPARGVYKKLCVADGRLVGAVLYGDTQDGAWYFDLIREGRDVRHLRDDLLFGARSEHVAAA
jgi:nitrite reductase (NADH) large subunit